MSHYSVTVIVHPKWIKQFRSGKMNLCTAFGMSSNYNKVKYNIIATHEDTAPLNTITWVDDYSIAACKGGCEYGDPVPADLQLHSEDIADYETFCDKTAYVVPSTYPVDIKFNQSVRLLKDWTMQMPDPDTNAPINGYLFINAPSASALVFKTIRNKMSPVYVTSVGGTPPPGQHTLTPEGRVMLFFADAEARTAFNVNFTNTDKHEYSYIDHPHVTVYFNDEGLWETVDEHSSDAAAIDKSVLAQHLTKSPAAAIGNNGGRGTIGGGGTSKL